MDWRLLKNYFRGNNSNDLFGDGAGGVRAPEAGGADVFRYSRVFPCFRMTIVETDGGHGIVASIAFKINSFRIGTFAHSVFIAIGVFAFDAPEADGVARRRENSAGFATIERIISDAHWSQILAFIFRS